MGVSEARVKFQTFVHFTPVWLLDILNPPPLILLGKGMCGITFGGSDFQGWGWGGGLEEIRDQRKRGGELMDFKAL